MSHLEDTLASHIKLLGLPEPIREYVAIPGRRFRWDFAWPQFRLLLEVQGGTWGKGGKGGSAAHSGGMAASRDCEKGNLATCAGWRTLSVTTDQIRKGQAVRFPCLHAKLMPCGGLVLGPLHAGEHGVLGLHLGEAHVYAVQLSGQPA